MGGTRRRKAFLVTGPLPGGLGLREADGVEVAGAVRAVGPRRPKTAEVPAPPLGAVGLPFPLPPRPPAVRLRTAASTVDAGVATALEGETKVNGPRQGPPPREAVLARQTLVRREAPAFLVGPRLAP